MPGDYRVTYGAPGTVTVRVSGKSGFTMVAKSRIKVTGSSCYLPAGTLLATFSRTRTGTYLGRHFLWFTSNCAPAGSATFRPTVTRTGFTSRGDRKVTVYTRITSRAVRRPTPLRAGDYRVTYGAPGTVTVRVSGKSGFTMVAKSRIKVTGSSCYLPAGTLLATFSRTRTGTYLGRHYLWFTSNCAPAGSATFSPTVTRTGFSARGDGRVYVYTRL